MFDPNIVFDLPEGEPPYTPTEFLDQQNSYYAEFRRMYLFIKGGNDNLRSLKRESLFVQFLEGLDKEDAKMVIAMKDKKAPYPNITYDLVHTTFPGLLPEPKDVPKINTVVAEPKKAVGSGARNEELERACPFGCISSRGSQYYMPGPLSAHLKKKHNFTNDELQQFKQEQY
jgi:hypothetical protein